MSSQQVNLPPKTSNMVSKKRLANGKKQKRKREMKKQRDAACDSLFKDAGEINPRIASDLRKLAKRAQRRANRALHKSIIHSSKAYRTDVRLQLG